MRRLLLPIGPDRRIDSPPVESLAQLVDHPMFDPRVAGLNPARPTSLLPNNWRCAMMIHNVSLFADWHPVFIEGMGGYDPRDPERVAEQVCARLSLSRGLICLDEHIADYHARDADRHGVILEFRYSQLLEALPETETLAPLEVAIGVVPDSCGRI